MYLNPCISTPVFHTCIPRSVSQDLPVPKHHYLCRCVLAGASPASVHLYDGDSDGDAADVVVVVVVDDDDDDKGYECSGPRPFCRGLVRSRVITPMGKQKSHTSITVSTDYRHYTSLRADPARLPNFLRFLPTITHFPVNSLTLLLQIYNYQDGTSTFKQRARASKLSSSCLRPRTSTHQGPNSLATQVWDLLDIMRASAPGWKAKGVSLATQAEGVQLTSITPSPQRTKPCGNGPHNSYSSTMAN